MTAFINSQPLRITDGVTHLGGDGWYCVPCYPDLPDDSDEWPAYGMLNLDPVTLGKSGLDPDGHILSIEDAKDILRTPPHVNPHLYARPVQMEAYPFIYGTVSFWFASCENYEGVYGVEGRRFHTPDYHDEIFCSGIGCICSSGPAWFVGACHYTNHTRNLNHDKEKADDKKYMHCLGLVWSGTETNLLHFVEGFGLDLSNRVKWVVNDKPQTDHKLKIGSKPGYLKPKIFRIRMLEKNTGDEWDRFILTVNRPDTYTSFTNWVSDNANTNWTLNLPQPFASITVSNGVPSVPESELEGSGWHPPETKTSYLHHDACYEMRSKPITGGYGHQAMYDKDGILIRTTIAAGTADIFAPYDENNKLIKNTNHRDTDVFPFIQALQLDGNPVHIVYSNWSYVLMTDIPIDLDRPCMYEGDYTRTYLKLRPPLPTGIRP